MNVAFIANRCDSMSPDVNAGRFDQFHRIEPQQSTAMDVRWRDYPRRQKHVMCGTMTVPLGRNSCT